MAVCRPSRYGSCTACQSVRLQRHLLRSLPSRRDRKITWWVWL